MNTNERPTPETDAVWEKHSGTNAELALDAIALCGRLERERDDAREELAETRKDYQCLASQLDGHDATECAENLKELKRMIVTLQGTVAKALETVAGTRRTLNTVLDALRHHHASRPGIREIIETAETSMKLL